MTILVPKRGGAVKALCLVLTSHTPSIRNLVAASEDVAMAEARRKIYYLHPISDSRVVSVLREAGYQVEGALRAPYSPSVDALVLSKFLG